MKNIYPCIWFDNNAKEAAYLYTKVFKNSVVLDETDMVINFSIDGNKIMTLNGGPMFKPNPSISFFVIFDAADEVVSAYEKLVDGGIARMPLDTYPWAKKYAWVEDKFGVSWQLSFSEYHKFSQRVTPLLMFTQNKAGKTKEAMDYYISIFPNSKINTVAEYLQGEGDTPGFIKHAQFSLNGHDFMAMDSSADHKFVFNEGISIVVECDSQEEIDHYWNSLTKGGEESMCGWLKDMYGVWWQIIPSILGGLVKDPIKGPKVVEAFLKMKKFDIKTLLQI